MPYGTPSCPPALPDCNKFVFCGNVGDSILEYDGCIANDWANSRGVWPIQRLPHHPQYLFEQWTNSLYFNRQVLKRRGDMHRYTSENFWDLFVTSLLPVFLLVKHILSRVATEGLDWSFHPVDIILSTTAIYLCFDTFHYFAHRLLHGVTVPSLYRAIHKRHHEEVPVHIYHITGKANFLESVLASSPGMTAWVLLTNYWFFRHPGSINL
ncbi:hypothetical protein DFS34DRAFT_588563 [Phlyctochytrium arcticum]|nr:hypothetical protein DFS34DRAFT_588563 [Phlyctochytrium arcticum]